jgi:hypothetical protein
LAWAISPTDASRGPVFVEEVATPASTVALGDDAVDAHEIGEVVIGRRDHRFMASEQPAAGEDALEIALVELGREYLVANQPRLFCR